MRTLLVINASPDPDLPERIARGDYPRKDYLELQQALDAAILDNSAIDRSSWARCVRRVLGRAPAQALLAWRRSHGYDAIFVDGEAAGFLLAALFLWRARRPRLVMIGHSLSAPKKQILCRALGLGRCIDSLIVHASTQQRVAVRALGLAPDQVDVIPYQTDERFWSPEAAAACADADADAAAANEATATEGTGEGAVNASDGVRATPPITPFICSAGLESRDYDTLIAALGHLPPDCLVDVVIAAASQWSRHGGLGEKCSLPPNVIVGSFGYARLRAIYARSHFVVVPLLDVDNQAGITTIMEAMSMGKAVIVSHARGQTDVVRDRRGVSRRDQSRPTRSDWAQSLASSMDDAVGLSGHTGIYVAPGDPVELARAIAFLLTHPDEAAEMGHNGRLLIERTMGIDYFRARVAALVRGDQPSASGAVDAPARAYAYAPYFSHESAEGVRWARARHW